MSAPRAFGADLAATRLFLEAEEFDGLLRYPDDRPDLKQWYAREATCRYYGAPGKGAIAAVHETANTDARTATKSLPQPIPAGRYRVFVRVVGNVFHEADNILRVSLGGTSVDFSWRRKHAASWLPGQEVELKRPAEKVGMTAVQLGGTGLRILYECQSPSIWVDSIYLTSDLTETNAPPWPVEQSLRTGQPLSPEMFSPDFRLEVPETEQYRTPAVDRPVVAGVIPLNPLDGRRNLWPNASFELGLNDGWAAMNNAINYAYVFSERDHDASAAAHGKYSLRIPAGANPFSRIYQLPTAGRMTLSVYVKAARKDKVTVALVGMHGRTSKDLGKPLISIAGETSTDWQRLSASGDVAAGLVCLQITNPSETWIDGIQLEAGDLSDFAPRAALEGSLATDELGNILYADRDTTLGLWFHNSSPEARKASLRYRIVDVWERVVAEKETPPVDVPAQTTVRQPLELGGRTKGLFSVLSAVTGRDMPESELVYAVIPPPSRSATRHELASNMDCLPAAYELMARFGFRWQLYCKIRDTVPTITHPAPDQYIWGDRDLPMGGAFGMKTLPCLWPTRLPPWMIDPVAMRRDRRDVVRLSEGTFPTYPRLDAWRDYCQALAEHYKDTIRVWCIEDETEMYYSAHDFAPIVRATALGMHAADPTVKVGLSCMPEYTEELLTLVDPKLVGALGASSYGFLGHWGSRKIRHLQERYGVPWYCIGVGNDDGLVQMFHTLPGYKPVYWAAARTARELTDLCLNQDAKVIGHYTGRLWNRYGHYNTDFPLMDYEGSPLPHGFSYACVGLNLAQAVPTGDVVLRNLGIIAYLFELEGRTGAATWATSVSNYDLHWKPAIRRFKDVTLRADPGQLEILHMYGNPEPSAVWQDGAVRFGLDEAPVFIMDNGLGKAAFIERLQGATAAPLPVRLRLLFLPGEKTGIDLACVATHQSGPELTGLKFDARVLHDRLLSKTEWVLPLKPVVDFGGLKPNETSTVRLPTTLRGDAPIENATFQVRLTDGQGIDYPWFDILWLLNAPKRVDGMKLDGDLSEWTGRSPGWLYYTWAWGRFGRDFVQVCEGGEHFNYATILDLRAAVWAAWDDTNLSLALRIDDDQIVEATEGQPGETVTVRIDLDLLKSSAGGTGDDEVEVVVVPGKAAKANLRASAGSAAAAVACKPRADGWDTELSLPWTALNGHKPGPDQMLGFDVLVTDVDREGSGLTVGKIRWAGGSQGLGHLYLGNP
jgi:hypothetical protein